MAGLILGMAVVGLAVGGGVMGGQIVAGQANAQAVVESARLKATLDFNGICRQQETEDRRICSEKKQADNWLAFDNREAKADRQEAIDFQKKLDQSMGIYQDEQHIQQHTKEQPFNDQQYHYPTPVAQHQAHAAV